MSFCAANLPPRVKYVHPLHLPRGETRSERRERVEVVEPKASYPLPEIPARTADLSVVHSVPASRVVPRAPRSFVNFIEAHESEEFSYDVREARGWMPDTRTGEPKELVDSISIRVRCARGRLALVWVEGRIDTCLAWTPNRGIFPITLTQAKAFVQGAEIAYFPKVKAESKPASKKAKEGMR